MPNMQGVVSSGPGLSNPALETLSLLNYYARAVLLTGHHAFAINMCSVARQLCLQLNMRLQVEIPGDTEEKSDIVPCELETSLQDVEIILVHTFLLNLFETV